MPNHYDKLKESASPTERKKTLTDAQVRGRAAIKKRLQTQEENKKKETAAKNKIQAEKSKVSLAKAIELGKKRHAKRQKDANKKPSSNLPPWIERKVQREVDSFKAMYDDKRSKRKEKAASDLEKRREKLTQELGKIGDMKSFDPEAWDNLSEKEKLFFKNKNAAKERRQNEILEELNQIRESQGKDPLKELSPYSDEELKTHALVHPSGPISPPGGYKKPTLPGSGGVNLTEADNATFKKLEEIYLSGNQTAIDSLDKAINALSNNQKVAGTKPPSATEALKKFLNK
jgi:hypothetical protein